jgi:Uncharacterized conserved protein
MTTREFGDTTLTRVEPYVWEIARTDEMRVPARVFASEALLAQIGDDRTLSQVQDAAHLPGVAAYTACLPDGHQGYGFPIGGVAGIDAEDGCISPGAIGYDINCGVRMLTTPLDYDDVRGREEELVEALATGVPAGLGGGGVVETDVETVDEILARGVEWAREEGYAAAADLAHCEDEGRRVDADPSAVSREAKERGAAQVGSLGSGNHFLEVERVTDVYRPEVAATYGLREDQVVVLIHCGSRGLGHQVCTNYLRAIERDHADLLERLPETELAAAPAGSRLADEYFGAMCAATNFAWVTDS